MDRILITGATGNVGLEIIRALSEKSPKSEIYAGVKDPGKADERLLGDHVKKVAFDFTKRDSIAQAFRTCDILFLLRPPQISDVKKYFAPLIDLASEQAVKHIVFLSVQGVEKSTIIPHHKIEKLIVESGINYTFLRPAYFMQNFLTTLRKDLIRRDLIYLPAGDARFTLIDLYDVGRVGAEVLLNSESHMNQAYDLTNDEQLTFEEMAKQLSEVLGRNIRFKSPDLLSFYLKKKKNGMEYGMIMVMIMLHFLPRFQKTPETTNSVNNLTGFVPASFREFILKNEKLLR